MIDGSCQPTERHDGILPVTTRPASPGTTPAIQRTNHPARSSTWRRSGTTRRLPRGPGIRQLRVHHRRFRAACIVRKAGLVRLPCSAGIARLWAAAPTDPHRAEGGSEPATECDFPFLAMPTQLWLQRSRARRELRARYRVIPSVRTRPERWRRGARHARTSALPESARPNIASIRQSRACEFAHRHQPGSGRRRCWWSTSSRGAGVTASGVEQQHDQWALRPTSPATVTGRAFGAGAASLETRGKENRRGASTARRSHPRAEPPVRRRRQDTCRASPSESLDRDDQALPWPLHFPAERPSRSNRPRCGTRPPRRRVVVRMDHEGRTLARPAH